VQRFCGLVAVVSPTSRNHSLDLILSVSTKTPEQGNGRHSLYVGSQTTSDANAHGVAWETVWIC